MNADKELLNRRQRERRMNSVLPSLGVAAFRQDFTTDRTDDTDESRAVRIHFRSVPSAVQFLWLRLCRAVFSVVLFPRIAHFWKSFCRSSFPSFASVRFSWVRLCRAVFSVSCRSRLFSDSALILVRRLLGHGFNDGGSLGEGGCLNQPTRAFSCFHLISPNFTCFHFPPLWKIPQVARIE